MSIDQINSGSAYQKFIDIVKEQGGDKSFIENPKNIQVQNSSLN